MNISGISGQQGASAYTVYSAAAKEKSQEAADAAALTEETQEALDGQSTKSDEKSLWEIELEALREQAEASDEAGEEFMEYAKCLTIARRIQNGDKVPLKDSKFLAEKQPDLYKNALTFRMQNDDPKEYKSCLDEEDEDSGNDSADSTNGAEILSAEGITGE